MRRFHLVLVALCAMSPLIGVACGGGDSTATGKGPLPDGATSGDGSTDNGGDATIRDDAGNVLPGDAGADARFGADGSPGTLAVSNVVVDQFGYRTLDEKIAVIRSPRAGFDVANPAFAPGPTYAVVDAQSSAKVYEGAPVAWNGGVTDHSSGDVVWHFDFSRVVTAGTYFILDEANDARSANFRVGDDVYKDTLTQATRMLYYQRDGLPKTARFAGSDWADSFAHPQNAQCTLGGSNGAETKDLHGGWFDAGDQNKYTSSTAGNVIQLLRAYVQTPGAFGDATNIPESGNGVPDVLDEAKWALDWLGRMQNSSDGSLLSVVANAGSSPPSADTAPCFYGPANTSSTWSAAAAFAYASLVFNSVPAIGTAYPGYAATLATRAANAWTWASNNPRVVFQNVPASLGTREQEVDDAGRVNESVEAAVYLFELTGTASYRTFVDATYTQVPTVLDPFNPEPVESLLEYTKTTKATPSPSVVSAILGTLGTNGAGFADFGAEQSDTDPYLAYLPIYPESSNRGKVGEGNLALDVGSFSAFAAGADGGASSAPRYAERYVHYLHGVNPLGLVYLSNMNGHGATRSVTQFFDVWFFPGTRWSTVSATQPGPAPGFLTAGPDNRYHWDPCCPNTCGTANACGAAVLSPPAGQPDQKSYLDFNTSYPYDSWQVSESYDLTETQYIRLLSTFAN